MEVKDKIVIVTGAAQGLGKAFAERLLQEGAKVCLSDVNVITVDELKEKFGKDRVHFTKCNVKIQDEFRGLYDECENYFGGPVSILVNNAGVNTKFGWKNCMDVNIMGVMIGTELALERMSVTNGGSGGLVVNIASLSGLVTPSMTGLDNYLAADVHRSGYSYTVSKHGVVALTRSLGKRQVNAVHGVKVQALCPSFTDTEMVSSPDPRMAAALSKGAPTITAQLLSPGYVADSLMKLITECSNGDILVVSKEGLYTLPSISTIYVAFLSIVALIQTKVTGGGGIFHVWQQISCIAVFLFLLHLFFRWILF